MPLTIVHLLAPAQFGGLESVVRLLATGQHAREHRVIVAPIVTQLPHPFIESMQALDLEVMPIVNRGRAYHREREAVATLIRDASPNIVHSHGYQPDIIDLPIARRSGIATVSTLHGFIGGDWKLRVYERLQLRALRASNAVIAVSRGVARRAALRGISQDKLHLIPNAYRAEPMRSREEARRSLNIPDDAFRIVWIGRIQHEKGPDVIIEAMKSLRDTHITLSILGDGPMRHQLEQRAMQLGIQHKITWHGSVPGSAPLLAAFDGCVMSSRSEGTPMVLLEAMAATLPIIATAVGGIPDMLTSQEAILVPTEDPEALAKAVHLMQRDREAAHSRALNAVERLDRDFSVDKWLDRHDELYHSIIREAVI